MADLAQSMNKPVLFECLRTEDVNLLTAHREQRIDIHPETGETTQYEVTTYPDWGYYNTAKMIPSLCYEVIFSDFIRGMVGAGGNIIVNMSDDAWFGQSSAANIHLSLALFRSAEYRVPLVRVTNSGFGAFVQAFSLHVPSQRSIYFYIGGQSSIPVCLFAAP